MEIRRGEGKKNEVRGGERREPEGMGEEESASMQSTVLAMIDSVCLTVCHTLVSCQNDSSYDYAVFTGG